MEGDSVFTKSRADSIRKPRMPEEIPDPAEPSPPSNGLQPTRRQFVVGVGAAVLATLARPITSFAGLEELLAADTTSLDPAFWSGQPQASFVVLGDFGSGFNNPQGRFVRGSINVNAKAVADGIARVLPYRGGGPIICVGDAIYVPFDDQPSSEYPHYTTTWLAENLSPYDQAVGVLYHHYIQFPKGSRSRFAKRGSRRQRFMTVLGDHDWWHVPRTEVHDRPLFEMDFATYGQIPTNHGQPFYQLTPDAPYLDYFGNQGGNLRYFRRRESDIEWFALSSDINETLLGTLENAYYHGPFPEGYSPGRENLLHSKQGRWFRKAVRTSKARWKFVNTHYPPYTSSSPAHNGHNPALYMRWGYEKYGVDAVFSGHVHAYERLYVHGVTYVVTGAGGTFEALATFRKPAAGSQKRVKNLYGFVSAQNSETGKIFFRYLTVRPPDQKTPPTVADQFVLVRGGTLDTKAEIEAQNGIHITAGGGAIKTAGFSAAVTGNLLGTGRLTKMGSGTLKLDQANPDFTGHIELRDGEITLMNEQAVGAKAGWTLGSGTLRVANGSQVSDRPLHLAGEATIVLGTGASLSFDTSSGETWTGRVTINSATGSSVRFGTDANALTAGQLARIAFADAPAATARLNSHGFLVQG
jgi:hypothetical protein